MEIDDIFEFQNSSALTQNTAGSIATRVNERLQKRTVNMIHMLRDANLNSQNKILTMVIYKHNNQLRKQKSLQYAKRISNLMSKLDVVKIISLLECFKEQLKDQHCFSKLKDGIKGPSSSTDKVNTIKQLIYKSNLTKEILKSCKVALSVTITDLGSGTFVTFYTFVFAHLSRLAIIMTGLHKEFMELFKLLLEVSLEDVTLEEDLKASVKEQFDSLFSRKPSENQDHKIESSNVPVPEEIENKLKKDQCSEKIIGSLDMGEIISRKVVDHDERVNKSNTTKKTTKKLPRHNCMCWKCCQNRKYFRRARQTFVCKCSLKHVRREKDLLRFAKPASKEKRKHSMNILKDKTETAGFSATSHTNQLSNNIGNGEKYNLLSLRKTAAVEAKQGLKEMQLDSNSHLCNSVLDDIDSIFGVYSFIFDKS